MNTINLTWRHLGSGLVAALAAMFLIQAAAAGTRVHQLEHEGVQRSYRLYMPDRLAATPTSPLVIALHGRGSDGQRMERLSQLNTRAEELGFLVAYPDALDGVWFYPRGIGGFGASPDDTAFLLALIDDAITRAKADPRQVYVTGLSNGGFMAQRLACDAPHRIAAFAAVAATGFSGMETVCRADTPIAAMFIHGTADELVPWQGRTFEHPDGSTEQVTYSASRTLEFWSNYNRCQGELTRGEIPPAGQSPGTRVTVLATDRCDQGKEVVLFAIQGGGHNWPGVTGVIPPRVAGQVNLDIHATDAMLDFFQRHRISP